MILLSSLALAQSPAEIGELFASEATAHGPALLAGTGISVSSGSQVEAGKLVATLRLARGGEVRLCPDTRLTISAVDGNVPAKNQELILSLDTGSVEFDYPLNDLGDTLITPDFKIMLAGPGVFHFALGVNSRGDTCINPIHGNNASIVVSEMVGSGVYQVKPGEAVLFAGGKLIGRGPLQSECGCPKPAPMVLAESEQPSQPPTDQSKVAELAKPFSTPVLGAASDAPPLAGKPDATHMQVDVPLVYRGDQPEPAYTVARIRFSSLPNVLLAQETQKPLVLKPGKSPTSARNKESRGFFGRIKGFFTGLFHG